MSTTKSLHHYVISTYSRRPTIAVDHEKELFYYIWNIIEQRRCKLLRINGVENHLHLLVDLHPCICVAGLAAEIKRKSSLWMKKCGLFPLFEGWSKEYYAFSKSDSDADKVIAYIKNQKTHHAIQSLEDELANILRVEKMTSHDINI